MGRFNKKLTNNSVYPIGSNSDDISESEDSIGSENSDQYTNSSNSSNIKNIDSNFLYNEQKDNLYILIYKLGSGSYATIWYSFEIENFYSKIKNNKPIKINPRALKIHNSKVYSYGITETNVTKILTINPDSKNSKKCPNINYPLDHFILEDSIVIIVYELAMGSLYDLLKLFGKTLPIDFVHKIIPQLIEPIKFMHNLEFIHTDIKPENYLLMGMSEYQQKIYNYAINYGLVEKLKRILTNGKKNKFDFQNKNFQEQLNKFLKNISKEFNITNNIISELIVSNSIDNQSDDENESNPNSNLNKDAESEIESESTNADIKSFYSQYSDDENSEDYLTVESYDSRNDEYDIPLDIFHTSHINNLICELENLKNFDNNINTNTNTNITKQNYSDNDMNLFLNPIVKLTDFGTIQNLNEPFKTIQTRYYRAPELLLGLDYNQNIDVWSLGCTIFELFTGSILFDVCANNLLSKYDIDLLNISMIMEKITLEEQTKLFELIEQSPRKNYLINSNGCLNFIKKIECLKFDNSNIISNCIFKSKNKFSNNFDVSEYNEFSLNIVNSIDSMLKINSDERIMI